MLTAAVSSADIGLPAGDASGVSLGRGRSRNVALVIPGEICGGVQRSGTVAPGPGGYESGLRDRPAD